MDTSNSLLRHGSLESLARLKKSDEPRLPISLAGERRKGRCLVYDVERDIHNFKEKWLLYAEDDNIDDWLDFVSLATSETDIKQYKNYEDFGRDFAKFKKDEFLAERTSSISELQRLVDRAKRFDALVESSKERLTRACKDYISKYCLSFFPELENLDVPCVRAYENNINAWSEEVREGLKKVERFHENIKEISGAVFTEYIVNYGQILHFMNVIVDIFSDICNPLKSWIIADEGYLKKVRLELEALSRRHQQITEMLRRNHFRIEDTKSRFERSKYSSKRVQQALQGRINDRRFCRRRELSFEDHISMTERMLEERKREHEETLAQIQNEDGRTSSQDLYEPILARSKELQKEIKRLDKRLRNIRTKRRNMKEDRYNVQKDLHKLKNVYEDHIKQTEKVKDSVIAQKEDAESFREEIKVISAMIQALHRIIEVKEHPSTVKKIFLHGYTPGEKMDFRGGPTLIEKTATDSMKEAINLTVPTIGKDWSKMYQQLPFSPPRDPITRSKDLDVLKFDFYNIHPPSEEMAYRSLKKWQELSSVTSVNALARTLKSIRRPDVAQIVEKKVITIVN
ncbi:hypothetical protein ACJMK2_012313 [Sinanodonta woodiana]|uniref:Death domain-containing protein n=1 Tax=Sinanodonta woodiana TaxID=1069815 RepID=A0ABD3V9D8_SINWO